RLNRLTVSLSSLLLTFDPTDDLIGVEDQSAVGLEPEVREPSGNEGLPYGPGRAADELGNLADRERGAKLHVKRVQIRVCRGLGKCPSFAQKWRRRLGPRIGRATAQARRR